MKTPKLKDIKNYVKKTKKNNQKIVLITGVFDVIHKEHINFLKKAKKIGDVLIVGLETDKRVKYMKGPNRPIKSQPKRYQNLKNLKIADKVFMLPENFFSPKSHQKLISQIKPDILAISSHTKHQAEKRKIIEKFNGKLSIVHQHNPKISTSQIIKKPQ